MKKIITCPMEKKARKRNQKKQSRRTKKRVRQDILARLFPEGVKEEEVLNGFNVFLRGDVDWDISDNNIKAVVDRWISRGHRPKVQRLSLEKIQIFEDLMLKLQLRIKQHFKRLTDQFYIIYYGEFEIMKAITRTIWRFYETHGSCAKDGIFLCGKKLEDTILYEAALAVGSMLWEHAKVNVPVCP